MLMLVLMLASLVRTGLNSAYRVYVFTYKRSIKLSPGKGCLGYPRPYNKALIEDIIYLAARKA